MVGWIVEDREVGIITPPSGPAAQRFRALGTGVSSTVTGGYKTEEARRRRAADDGSRKWGGKHYLTLEGDHGLTVDVE